MEASTSPSFKRPAVIRPLAERTIHALEDRQRDLCLAAYQRIWSVYRRKRFWPFWLGLLGIWLVFPWLGWRWYRERIPERALLAELAQELSDLDTHRQRRRFWQRWWKRRNLVQSQDDVELRRFYQTLAQTARQYNIRVGLLDFALDRQSKKLDEPFTSAELEQIEASFQRVQDELDSALRLIKLAEKNPDLDLVQLLQEEYGGTSSLTPEFINNSSEWGQAGPFVQELLLLESSLREEIEGITRKHPNPSSRHAA
ncbi:MAG: hypothetical protein ACO4AU_02195 [bacterium]|jgi:hypothetical protein